METKLIEIAAKARCNTALRFTSLCHHITRERMWRSLKHTAKNSAVGVDGINAKEAREPFQGWIGACFKQYIVRATRLRLSGEFGFRNREKLKSVRVESTFRTLKYRPDYPIKPFDNLLEARAWVEHVVHWYNHVHRHSGIEFVTPAQRHAGLAQALLAQRKIVYTNAHAANFRHR